MGISIYHNMLAINSERMLGLNRNKKAESTRKLSSGYKINRAADDAAGLAISEKMRRQIRGLSQGTENATDGISWVQIGDGALEESQEMLQRMNELSIKSMNGTNSAGDRQMIDDEFQQLKKELNRVSAATKFNEQRIFSNHKPDWYKCDGAVSWPLNQLHTVTEGDNDLIFKYRETAEGEPKTISFTVPAGEYSTQELLDELDSSILKQMDGYDRWFEMEYDADGCINAILEGGAYIDSITGGLSYLMYDTYRGGGTGALLGTTSFPTKDTKLLIAEGKNNSMTFVIEDLKGNQKVKTLELKGGLYTRDDLIRLINEKLEADGDTSVRADEYGRGIRLGSTKEFVTSFQGNMFRIDGSTYSSIFYDNVSYGNLTQEPAIFTGGCVLSSYSRDEEHRKFIIDNTNNSLTLQPGGRQDKVTLTIAPGEYTAWEMRDELNRLFAQKDSESGFEPKMNLQASVISVNSVPTGNHYNTTFYGIQIQTSAKGPDSIVNIDPGCSAYNTLFVNREYNYYGEEADIHNASHPAQEATLTGVRSLNDISAQKPFVLTDRNNSFEISFKETGASAPIRDTITLTPGSYTKPGDLLAELRNQLANSKCAGLVTASLNSFGNLYLSEANGKDIDGYITVNEVAGSGAKDEDTNGYWKLFVGLTRTETGIGTLSFDTPGKANSGQMQITVNGSVRTVTIGPDLTKDQIAERINASIKPQSITSPNQFSYAADTGDNQTFSVQGKGTVTPVGFSSGSAKGTSSGKEGIAGVGENTPASLTLDKPLKNSIILDDTNNKIKLTLNGETKTLTLDTTKQKGNQPYTLTGLAEELQAKIDAAYGTDAWGNGALVTVNNNRLVLTTRLPGDSASIDFNAADNRYFLANLGPAVCRSDRALQSTIKPEAGKTDFILTYDDGENGSKKITLKLDENTSYDRNSLKNAFNKQLQEQGYKIEASLNGNYLEFSSKDALGQKVSLSFSSGSPAADAMFGLKSQASITLNANIQDKFTIEAGKQDFKISVNGITRTLQLDAREYTSQEDFRSMLQGKLDAANLDVTATLSGKRLVLTAKTKGSTSLSASYDSSSTSAMSAIYGSTKSILPGIEASWENDRLVLKAVNDKNENMTNVTISVTSNTSGGLLEPVGPNLSDMERPHRTFGRHEKTLIQGVAMSKVAGADTAKDTVTIDRWNKNLRFEMRRVFPGSGSSYFDISATLTEGTYTYDKLAEELETKLNNNGYSVRFHVEADDSGVRIETVPSESYYCTIYTPYDSQNGFYHKVLCEAVEKEEPQTVTDARGTQKMEPIYTLGRKDLSSGVEISRGFSDEFSFYLTIGDKSHEIKVTLDPGTYSGEALRAHLQELIDRQIEQLEQRINKGLKPGLIRVGVGDISSNVAGEVPNALNLSIDKDVQAPGDGEYIIDGVGGNAAFEIFYQTEGKIMPAYIMGTKDVRGGVTLPAEDAELTFEVDGKNYDIQLAPGDYTSDEILDALNDAFQAGSIPLFASLNHEDGRVRVSYEELGHHEISSITGSAKGKVFFDETGGSDHSTRYVQLSSEIPDHIELKRSEFSAGMLRIASLHLTSEKGAAKAIDRLGMAINRVSALRSDFGSTQNRLEHALNNNRNKEENLQHAESVIRDTDMANEMVRFSNLNILEQAIAAVLAQANQQHELVLNLLQQ